MKTPQQLHIPVLLNETISLLAPEMGESYLDLTAGYGGHASKILELTRAPEKAVLVDRDAYAIAELQKKCGLSKAKSEHSDFLAVAEKLVNSKRKFDLVLMDLGVSSVQFDMASRGFSFRVSAPLDMRMDPCMRVTAYDVVNKTSESELTKIIQDFGEEKPKTAQKIAHAIAINRPVKTTVELAELVRSVSPRSRGKIHPATRTFQAIRIKVNDELGQLEKTLPLAVELLSPGGRLAVISFHSLEDRIVKNYFNEQSTSGYEADVEVINKKPLTASDNELVYNPRSRSAKLRGVVKK